MVMASTSFCSRILRKSFSVAGASPISCCARSANFLRILLSTSQTCEMRAALPVRLERREMSVGAAIQTDHGKVEAVIRAKDLAIALCRSSHGQSRRAHGKCIEKLTSCNHHFSLRHRSDRARSAGNSSLRQRLLESVHADACGRFGRALRRASGFRGSSP